MPGKARWIGTLAGILAGLALVGLLGVGGCSGKGAVREHERLPDLADAGGMTGPDLGDCPGQGYDGRLRRDLTQPYADRQYLLDDGRLCRPRP